MKKYVFIITYFIVQVSFAQTYEEQLGKAGVAIGKKDYCAALSIFKNAFKDETKIGTYDYAYAALSAANCKEEQLALQWFKKAADKGFGQNPGEIDFIITDSGFEKLHAYKEWNETITFIRKAIKEKEILQKKKNEEWLSTINKNAIKPKINGKFSIANAGFAVYFTKVDTLKVPYLVYVPKKYNPKIPTKAVVYLHGGVVNTESFNYQNTDLATGEPIFALGEKYNAIIIYPFGKKDFGWVNQLKAFENVNTIVKQVQQTYNMDKKNIFLGGMSNGGTATFWFASQKNNMYKAFYTFSALPKLEIETLNFSNLTKPIFSVHAKDDDLYKIEDVQKMYETQKSNAKNWQLEIIENGGHGFIYQPNGKEIIESVFRKMIGN
jgi:predicted esterase